MVSILCLVCIGSKSQLAMSIIVTASHIAGHRRPFAFGNWAAEIPLVMIMVHLLAARRHSVLEAAIVLLGGIVKHTAGQIHTATVNEWVWKM